MSRNKPSIAPVAARSRIPSARPGAAAEVTDDPTTSVRSAVAAYFMANVAANTARRHADSQKSALNKAMLESGVEDIETLVTMPDGSTKRVKAEISPGTEDYISVALLQKQVSSDVFMKIIQATQTAVVAFAGTNVKMACLETRVTPPALKVPEVK